MLLRAIFKLVHSSTFPAMKMDFKRSKDPEYPLVYETWTTERGQEMVIQDLRPEDEDVAVELMELNMLPDETLAVIQRIREDPDSLQEMLDLYRYCLSQRLSLGCYELKDGEKHLVAMNVLFAGTKGKKPDIKIKSEKFQNVFNAAMYVEKKCNAYEHMGLDTLLQGVGLCVRMEYRGMRIGQKILAAREPLCKAVGIKGTSTLFTGLASQKQAEQCGFETIADFPIKELAEAGLPYPADDERRLKYMIKIYK